MNRAIKLTILKVGLSLLTLGLIEGSDDTVLFHFDANNLPDGEMSPQVFTEAASFGVSLLKGPMLLSLSNPEEMKIEVISLDTKKRALRIHLPMPSGERSHNSASILIQDNELGTVIDSDKPLNIELTFRRSIGGINLNGMLIFVQDSVRINLPIGGINYSATTPSSFFMPSVGGGKPEPLGDIPADEVVTLGFRLTSSSEGMLLFVRAFNDSETFFEGEILPDIPPPVGEDAISQSHILSLQDLRAFTITATVWPVSGDTEFLDILSFRSWQ